MEESVSSSEPWSHNGSIQWEKMAKNRHVNWLSHVPIPNYKRNTGHLAKKNVRNPQPLKLDRFNWFSIPAVI